MTWLGYHRIVTGNDGPTSLTPADGTSHCRRSEFERSWDLQLENKSLRRSMQMGQSVTPSAASTVLCRRARTLPSFSTPT
jgi:hypothetical protein